MNRRDALSAVAGSALALAGVPTPSAAASSRPVRGRLRQAVTRQLFPADFSLQQCCQAAAELGATGFDFVDAPADWPLLRQHGLTLSMLRLDYGGGISSGARSPPGPPGWNAVGLPAARGEFLQACHAGIDTAAAQGFPNLFVAAGTRDTVTSAQGADNAVAFFDALKGHAEERGVTVCMELLNSRGIASPRNYLFDHLSWGVDVVARVNSPRVRILYDCFHAQLMEGNIVNNLRENLQWIAHVHLGGVPGRHELDDTQELNYRCIARTLADLGFRGFVTHEWSPSRPAQALSLLRQSMQLVAV